MDILKTNSIQKILKTFVIIFLGTIALTISSKLKIFGKTIINSFKIYFPIYLRLIWEFIHLIVDKVIFRRFFYNYVIIYLYA